MSQPRSGTILAFLCRDLPTVLAESSENIGRLQNPMHPFGFPLCKSTSAASILFSRIFFEVGVDVMSTATVSVDEFQALEQKVLRAVEIIKQEREARAKAEAEIASLREQIEFQTLVAQEAQTAVNTLTKDRDNVRQRVEKMLQQMDELV